MCLELCRTGVIVKVGDDGEVSITNRNHWDKTMQYLFFVYNFTSIVFGKRKLDETRRKFPQRCWLGKQYINFTDEAFALVIIQNNQDMWKDQYLKEIRDSDINRNGVVSELARVNQSGFGCKAIGGYR